MLSLNPLNEIVHFKKLTLINAHNHLLLLTNLRLVVNKTSKIKVYCYFPSVFLKVYDFLKIVKRPKTDKIRVKGL